MKPALFLDRDGALLFDGASRELRAGVASTLRRLAGSLRLLALSRDAAFSAPGPSPTEHWLGLACARGGARLDGFYRCHHADAGCDCRMPRPGLLWQAARDHRIDLSRSWMVTDTLDGIEAGRRAGCRTILVDNGREHRWELTPIRTPHHVVARLAAVVAIAGAGTHQQWPGLDDREPAWGL